MPNKNKTMKYIITSSIIFVFCFSLFAENPCNIMSPRNSGEWGQGICYFPEKSKIPFYFNDNDSIAGYIVRPKNNKLKLEFLNDSTEPIRINFNDFNWIGHSDAYLLKVYGVINGNYYKVFSQSYGKGILIKKDELKQFGIEYFDYRSLILYPTKIDLPDEMLRYLGFANIGLNLYKSCINLRMGPSTEFEILKCLKSNDWADFGLTKMKIIETKGNWAKIEAETFIAGDEECEYIKDKDWIGWIKAIDDNGKPNIWYSVTSY